MGRLAPSFMASPVPLYVSKVLTERDRPAALLLCRHLEPESVTALCIICPPADSAEVFDTLADAYSDWCIEKGEHS